MIRVFVRRRVLPGLVIVVVSWGLAVAGWSRPDPSPAAERVRQVRPLSFLRSGNKCGGVSPQLTIRVSPSDNGQLQIGLIEDRFFGHGAMSRAAYWMAGVVAGLVSRRPMGWRITFVRSGWFDGPSAGGLMTATILAAVLNQPFLPKVTMTGTINPDGTIGPVGGIYYKLLGAKKAGMTKVLIPAGQYFERSCGDRKRVSLFVRAKSLGIELVPVRDIYEAYFHLTGSPLPFVLDYREKLNLPGRARRAVNMAFHVWQGRFNTRIETMRALAKQVEPKRQSYMARLWRLAYDRRNQALVAYRKGQWCAAFGLMFHAANVAGRGALLSRISAAYNQGGRTAAWPVFRRGLINKQDLSRHLSRLSRQKIKTLNDLISMAEAYAYLDTGVGVYGRAQATLRRLRQAKNDEARAKIIFSSAGLHPVVRDFLLLTEDVMNIGLGYGGPPVPSLKRLSVWSRAMLRAAEANEGYFDRIVLDPLAKRYKRSRDVVRAFVLRRDMQYLLALLSIRAVRIIYRKLPAGVHRQTAVLGSATNAFSLMSLAVAKWYALGAKMDKRGMVVKIGREDRLAAMLRSARRHLRESILKARQMGYRPVMPTFHLKIAEALSGETNRPHDRLWALSEYWAGTIFGRLMGALAQPRPAMVGGPPHWRASR
ncbi:MAG: hypothetical protein KJ621_13040 [Proteobacteria bacterium]|nr:hypothetical protein [Pseudomonadota bacterium]MBU1741293.1 hypothetical protein [Pseudomonadota bacterium]